MSAVFADALTRQEYYDKYGEDYWAKMKAQNGERRDDYSLRATDLGRMQLRELEEMGYECEAMTEFQTRINGKLDVWWRNQKWHNIESNQRGEYVPHRMREAVQAQIGQPHAATE